MEERFGGLTTPKKGRAHTQQGVPTDHLANMDDSNIHRRQPRSWYTEAGDKFTAEYQWHIEEQFAVLENQIKALTTQLSNMGGHNGNGFGDPSTKRGTHRRQHRAQAHANQWENRFKLNMPEFQGWLQPENSL